MEESIQIFDWFDYNGVDDDKIVKQEKVESSFKSVFDIISLTFFILFCITFALNIFFIYVLQKTLLYGDINLTDINYSIMLFTGSFRCILFILFVFLIFLDKLEYNFFYKIFEILYRYITIFVWMFLYWAGSRNQPNDQLYTSIYLSVMFTSFVYGLSSLLIMLFEDNFISSSLRPKILRTYKTEQVLRSLKQYAYDLPHQSRSESDEYDIRNIFTIDLTTFLAYCIIYDENSKENYISQIADPEIWSIKDGIKLARDVFVKTASNEDEMTFEELQTVITDPGQFELIKSNIDVIRKDNITNVEFRDIVLNFYYHRLSLEKSIKSQISFINIIRQLFYGIVTVLLIIVYFLIFGVSIKELFAFIVSSAVIAHFIGSAMMKDVLKGIIFMLSHRFDIGDEVIISGKDMVVHSTGIISTTFILGNGGVIKFLNSELCNTSIINITSAPESLLVFNFDLPSLISEYKLNKLKREITNYLRQHPFDYYEDFVVINPESSVTDIKAIKSTAVLKCKLKNSKPKRYMLRADFTSFITTKISQIFK